MKLLLADQFHLSTSHKKLNEIPLEQQQVTPAQQPGCMRLIDEQHPSLQRSHYSLARQQVTTI